MNMNDDVSRRRFRSRALLGFWSRAIIVASVPATTLLALGAWGWVARVEALDEPRALRFVNAAIPGACHGRGIDANSPTDEAHARKQLDVITTRILQLTATKMRLAAERDGAADIHIPAGFLANNSSAPSFVVYEQRLLEARRATVDKQKSLLDQRIQQVRHEIDALFVQHKARERELQFTRDELNLIDDMHGRHLTTVDRLMSLRRNLARYEGEIGALLSQIARARNQIAELDLLIVEVDRKAFLEAHKEIPEIDARIDELTERRLAIEARLGKVVTSLEKHSPE